MLNSNGMTRGTAPILLFATCSILVVFSSSTEAGSDFGSILDEQTFNSYVQLLKYAAEYQVSIDIPQLLLLGIQSAGKTSFIESFVGFPVGFTSPGTGTRCPVRYYLRFNSEAHQPRVKVDDKAYSAEDLRNVITARMQALGETFSEKMINVEIESSHIPNIVLVDLPGLVADEANPKKAATEKIARKFARDPQYTIVCIIRSAHDKEGVLDVSALDAVLTSPSNEADVLPPRKDWQKDAVFVVNYLNHFWKAWGTTKQANEYFKSFLDKGVPHYFVALIMDNAPRPDDFAAYSQYLKDHEELEQQAVIDKKKQLTPVAGQLWSSNNDLYLGVKRAKVAINDIWMAKFKQTLPIISEKLQARIQSLITKNSVLSTKLANSDPKTLRDSYRNYTLDWIKSMNALHSGTPVRDISASNSIFVVPKTYHFAPGEFGRTFEEELNNKSLWEHYNPDIQWEGAISLQELLSENHLKSQGLGRSLNHRLLGGSAYYRFVKIFAYMLVSRQFPHYTEDDIHIMAAALLGSSKADVFPTDKVVQQMAMDQIRRASEGVEWGMNHLSFIFDSYKETVHSYLTRRLYAHLQGHTKLQNKINSAYWEFLQDCIKKFNMRWSEQVIIKSEYLLIDAVAQMKMLLALTPLENTTLPETVIHPQPPPAVPLVSTHDHGQIPPSAVDRTPATENVEMSTKRDLIDKLSHPFRSHREAFTLADFIEGGTSGLWPMSYYSPDYDYLRSVAKQYYIFTLGNLAADVQSYFHFYFLRSFTSNFNADLEKSITAHIDKIDDNEILALANVDVEALNAELKKVVQELDEARENIRSLHQLQKPLSH